MSEREEEKDQSAVEGQIEEEALAVEESAQEQKP